LASTAQPPLRKDAARSRAAILTAARELFSSGRDVPMYEIGRRAGVGQATLYRHFPDRAAIVAAISREHVERIEALAAEHEDDGLAILIVLDAAADMLVRIHELVGILREDATLAPVLNELRQRMLVVLDATLDRSRASDLLRDDLRADDLHRNHRRAHDRGNARTRLRPQRPSPVPDDTLIPSATSSGRGPAGP